MNQVERGRAYLQIARQGLGILKIRLPDLNSGIFCPFAVVELGRRAHEATNHVAGIEQARSETPANIASGSRDRNTRCLGGFRQGYDPINIVKVMALLSL
jgi:hypothetical protein